MPWRGAKIEGGPVLMSRRGLLRGGEASILGVIFGASVMRVLYNFINILHIPTHLEFAIVGVVILFGVVADEVMRRVVANRQGAARR